MVTPKEAKAAIRKLTPYYKRHFKTPKINLTRGVITGNGYTLEYLPNFERGFTISHYSFKLIKI